METINSNETGVAAEKARSLEAVLAHIALRGVDQDFETAFDWIWRDSDAYLIVTEKTCGTIHDTGATLQFGCSGQRLNLRIETAAGTVTHHAQVDDQGRPNFRILPYISP